MTTSIILPTYNERDALPKLIERIAAVGLTDWEAIVVDDRSPDGTAEVAAELAQRFPVRVIVRSGKQGLASAVVRGFEEARGQFLVAMDADHSHDPAILPALVARLAQGADVVVGSRFAPGGGIVGWPAWRQWMSRVATWLATALFRVHVRDPMSGYFALQRPFFTNVAPRLNPMGYKILLELLVRGRPGRVEEVGFQFQDRRYGKSKISVAVVTAYLRMIIDLLIRR
ncbi:MAG: polyprenol monophosphomannose synthase [Candidatus Kerfeldbacteria bacterium]|nr:polyprenol monophosphomannose synthase [Candidatus Kerfeldbacteria bacterium]